MIYLLNTEIQDKKPTIIGLTAIYGIGKAQANKICRYAGISKNACVKNLSGVKKDKIISYIILNIKVNQNLRQLLKLSEKKQKRIRSYKGQRAFYKLPRRGQRTHTNAKTARKK
jgi:small subunit ribosomal protein S13